MSDDTTPDPDKGKDDPKPDGKADMATDAGKKALNEERKARRDADKKAADLEARLKDIEDKDKTEVERLTAKVTELETSLGAAMVSGARLEVALDKGLTAAQAKRLVGDTWDDLTADADELLADLGAKPSDERKPPPGSKPSEDLKPGGGDPDEPVETTDVKALAARMFNT